MKGKMVRREDGGDREYDASDKFGTPEDAPQTYILEDGTEVDEETFLEQLRKEVREDGDGRSRLYEPNPKDNS